MKCREIDEVLELYIRDELDDDQASAIADHLQACARCRTAYDETRALVGELLDLGDSFQPKSTWAAPVTRSPEASVSRSTLAPRPASRGWMAAAAAFAALAIVSSTLLAVPALAEQVTVLPVANRIAALEADAAELAATVERLETRIAEIGGEEVTLVETEPVLDDAANLAVQEQAMSFIRAMYAADIPAMQALSTPSFAEEIAARPAEYTREGGAVFAQINNVSEHEGLYWVFVRLSDTTEFTDSQYQLNIGLERTGEGAGATYGIAVVEMDA